MGMKTRTQKLKAAVAKAHAELDAIPEGERQLVAAVERLREMATESIRPTIERAASGGTSTLGSDRDRNGKIIGTRGGSPLALFSMDGEAALQLLVCWRFDSSPEYEAMKARVLPAWEAVFAAEHALEQHLAKVGPVESELRQAEARVRAAWVELADLPDALQQALAKIEQQIGTVEAAPPRNVTLPIDRAEDKRAERSVALLANWPVMPLADIREALATWPSRFVPSKHSPTAPRWSGTDADRVGRALQAVVAEAEQRIAGLRRQRAEAIDQAASAELARHPKLKALRQKLERLEK